MASQGRSARYGPRHLLQVVAIKRRQAGGRALADIQVELLGATDDTLRRIAEIPRELLAPPAGEPDLAPGPAPGRPRALPEPAPAAGRSQFWARQPAAATPATPPTVAAGDDGLLHGVRLGGVVLLLAAAPDADDRAAIRAAAAPLLHLLDERGLLNPPGRSPA